MNVCLDKADPCTDPEGCSPIQATISIGLIIAQFYCDVQSAALGLAIAGAIGLGYSNIFVTAPSPENLRTLFEFIFKVPSTILEDPKRVQSLAINLEVGPGMTFKVP